MHTQLQPAGEAWTAVVPGSSDAPNVPNAAAETDGEPVAGSSGSGTVSAKPPKGD